jgi:hypothetical protein
MEKYVTLFTRLNKFNESIIYVIDDFSLDVVGQGVVSCRHGKIVNIYHVPNISSNLLSIAQLTQTGNIMDFCTDQFYVKDLKKGKYIFLDGILYLMENLYKFHESTHPKFEPNALISHTDETS